MAAEPRLIKRYPNRKLYDTVESRYVTLDDIARMVSSGQEVRILDNATGQDMTSVTLAQIILETERRKRTFPLVALKRLVQGSNLGDLVSHLERGLDQTVGRVLGRSPSETSAPTSPPSSPGSDEAQTTVQVLREWLATSQRTLEDLQAKLDEHFRRLAEALSPVLRLQRQVSEIVDRLDRVERVILTHHPESASELREPDRRRQESQGT